MSTTIRIAKSTQDLNDIFHMRSKCLTESGISRGNEKEGNHRYIDALDISPSTLNIGAFFKNECISSIRANEYSSQEIYQNDVYNISQLSPDIAHSCYLLDFICILNKAAYKLEIIKQLLRMTLITLSTRGIEHACILSPEVLLVPLREFGFYEAAEPINKKNGEKVTPMLFEISKFYENFISKFADREIIRFQEAFYMSFFEPGEVMAVQGERGNNAHVLLEGEVEVLINTESGLKSIRTLSAGQLIGEVAMLTNDTRTASIVTKTKCPCVSFERAEFMKLLYAEPHRSMDIFKIFGKRLSESNKRLAEATSSK